MGNIPVLAYLGVWKGSYGIIFEFLPWLSWILVPLLIILALFVFLFGLTKAFDWDKNTLSTSTEALSKEIHSSSK
jgi:uncharacterized membrane protein